ncbi:hypothetical protein NPIL_382581 [Nephila pilipes]|uniref:Uncharacterized protein n=1 Tax=Nephila pilipes TaxID=299642 RepID=A0A8X6P5A0_NEPPI|nr:hypothetical protein NPIL_382581 [Nephila pilipes]
MTSNNAPLLTLVGNSTNFPCALSLPPYTPFRYSGHANRRVSVLEAVTRSILGFCWRTAQGSVRPFRVRCLLPSRHVEKRRRIESKGQLAPPPLSGYSLGG